jgi:hypothetical protein
MQSQDAAGAEHTVQLRMERIEDGKTRIARISPKGKDILTTDCTDYTDLERREDFNRNFQNRTGSGWKGRAKTA